MERGASERGARKRGHRERGAREREGNATAEEKNVGNRTNEIRQAQSI